LYDPCDAEHPIGPNAVDELLRFTVSNTDCNVTITGNAARGNVVMESTDAATTNLPSTCYMADSPPPPDCFPSAHPDYAEWVAMGKPTYWCAPKQCHGDATGSDQQLTRTVFVSVGSQDVSILLEGYNVLDTEYVDPDTDPWIAADFTHSRQQLTRTTYVRVGTQDVGELLTYYNVQNSSVPADCLDVP
jgi:hypothetical protein